MRRTTKRLTYANVAATLALVLSMGGGALAAKHYLINSASQINPKVLRSLRGAAGARGAPGAPGATGAPGPQGREGREGKEGQAAAIPALAWSPLVLEHRWEIFDSALGKPEATKDAEGFVHLKGAITGGSSTAMRFAVLPAGLRPTTDGILVRGSGTNTVAEEDVVDVFIEADGAMFAELRPGNNGHLVSLEGISFFAG